MCYFRLLPGELLTEILEQVSFIDCLSVLAAFPSLSNNETLKSHVYSTSLSVFTLDDIKRARAIVTSNCDILSPLITNIMVSKDAVNKLVKEIPYFIQECKNLRKVKVDDLSFDGMPNFMNTMHRYNRDSMSPILSTISFGIDDNSFVIHRPLPLPEQYALTTLHTSVDHFATYDDFFNFIGQFPTLETLDLQKAPPFPYYIPEIQRRCKELKTLRAMYFEKPSNSAVNISTIEKTTSLFTLECRVADFSLELRQYIIRRSNIRIIAFDGTGANKRDYRRLYDLLNSKERFRLMVIKFVNAPILSYMFDLGIRKYKLMSLSFLNACYEDQNVVDLHGAYIKQLIFDLTHFANSQVQTVVVQEGVDWETLVFRRDTIDEGFRKIDASNYDESDVVLKILNAYRIIQFRLVDAYGLDQHLRLSLRFYGVN